MQNTQNENASAGSHHRPPALWLHRYTLSCCLVRARPALFYKNKAPPLLHHPCAPEKYVQSVPVVTQLTHTTLDHSAVRNPEATERSSPKIGALLLVGSRQAGAATMRAKYQSSYSSTSTRRRELLRPRLWCDVSSAAAKVSAPTSLFSNVSITDCVEDG